MTLKVFYDHTYTPCGILSNLQIYQGEKTITIEVEVVDGPLHYNILLALMWVYAMSNLGSTYFCIIVFPHKGRIIVIDRLAFFISSS